MRWIVRQVSPRQHMKSEEGKALKLMKVKKLETKTTREKNESPGKIFLGQVT
jgi:hypothetical protein